MPSATATAKAIGSVRPTHTPTATPFHVVMEEAPFWNSAVGIFFVLVIATVVDYRYEGCYGNHQVICMFARPFPSFRVLVAHLAFAAAAAWAMAQDPTIKPSNTTEGMRGQQIVLSGANLPTTPDSISVRLGTTPATVLEATAGSLTFRIPDNASLGQQALSVTVPMGEKKEGKPITVAMMGDKKFFTVISDQVGPLKLGSVAPLVSYPSQKKHFDFNVLGQGFSRRGDDNQLEIENQGTLRIRWDETAANTAELDRTKYDGRGFVVSDHELEIRDVDKGAYRPPLKLRVRVGDQVTESVPITFAIVGEKVPLWGSIGMLVVLLAVVAFISSSGIGAQRTSAGGQVGLLGRFLLDTENDTYSLSKLQFYLWTVAAVFGYCFLTLSRSLIQGQFELAEIPDGLPGIIGASAATSILATGISAARGPKGAGAVHPGLSDFVTTGGVVAPERFQFLVWTLLGVASFVFLIVLRDPANLKDLPKIPSGFLYMMGISSAGYLGGKFARKPGPVIDSIIAQRGSLKLEIRGRNLSKDASYSVGDKEILYKLVTGNLESAAPSTAVEKDATLRIIAKEDDPNSETFAKAVLLTIDNPEPTWLTAEQSITITNPDGQKAVWPFQVQVIAQGARTDGADKLKSIGVQSVMIKPEQFKTLPDTLIGKTNKEIQLSDLVTYLEQTSKGRMPLFQGNQKDGPLIAIIPLNTIQKFLEQSASAGGGAAANLSLDDLLANPQFGPVLRRSFGLVQSDATLADAKSAMDKASAADIFVTATGSATEPVLGWITNDIINENAKV